VVEKRVVIHEPPLPRHQPSHVPALSDDQQQKRSELTERLRIGDVDDRIKAARDLVRFADDTKAREALERAVRSDRDAAVRKAAVEALAKQSGEKAVPTLKQAYAEDTDRDVRQAAYKALILIEGY
jgi:HEAT repeat protein